MPSFSVMLKATPASTWGTPQHLNVSADLEAARDMAAFLLDVDRTLIGLVANSPPSKPKGGA